MTMQGTSQAAPQLAGAVVLAQQIAMEQIGRRITLTEFGELLQSTGVLVTDGDDEDVNVTTTGALFTRLDILALAEALLELSTDAPGEDEPPAGGGGDDGPVGASAQPFTYTVILGPGEIREDIDFGVKPSNRVPTAEDDAVTTTEDTAVTIDVLGNDSDPDGDTLSIDSVTIPTNGTVAINADNTVTYMPGSDYNGSDSFTYTLIDGHGETDSAAVAVTVNPVNDAPTVDIDVEALIVDEGVVAGTAGAFADIDQGDTVGITASIGTITQTGSQSGTWTWSLATTDGPVQSQTVTITATDSGALSTEVTFDLTVNNVAPTVDAGPDATVDEGTAFTAPGSFSDPGTDTWIATVDYDDGAGAQPLPLTGTAFTLDHVYADHGTYTVTVTITDKDGGTGQDTLIVTVNDVEPIAAFTGDTTLDEGQSGSFDASGSTSFPDTIVLYEWDWDYDGVTFSPSGDTGAAQTQAWSDDGVLTVAVRVTDDDGSTDIANSDVIVNNVAPTIALSGATSVDEGAVYALTLGTVTDPGNDTVSQYIVHWGDGATDIYTASGEVTHVYADGPALRTVICDLVDEDGTYTEAGSLDLAVDNATPVVVLNPVDTIDENGTATVTGTITDPGVLDSFTMEVNWGDLSSPNNIETYTFAVSNTGSQSFALTHQCLDDNPSQTSSDSYTISVIVRDKDGGVDKQGVDLQVKNVAPVITECRSSATVDDKAAEGESVTVEVRFTDVGTRDSHVISIAWGDGEISQVSLAPADGTGVATDSHIYATGGIYEIEVTVEDDDTGLAQASTTAIVSGVGVHNRQLHIVGTDEADWVLIQLLYGGFNWQTFRYDGRERIRVYATLPNNLTIRDYDVTEVDTILVLLYGGNDTAMVSGAPSAAVLLDGGSGDDTLFGSHGNNILLGGPGNDTLRGGGGYDLLIGGTGRDTLIGDRGQSIFVGGQTAYDLQSVTNPSANIEALLAILDEWSSAKPYDQRRDNILGIAPTLGRLNHDFFLRPGETIFDDEEVDTILGGPNQDLFPDLHHDFIFDSQLLFSSFWRLWLPF